MLTFSDIDAAARIIYDVMPATPHYQWPLLSERAGCDLWIKHENYSPIGCFKLRGGLAYLEHVKRTGRAPAGVIAPTRGNHGQSVALAAKHFGLAATIVVPMRNSREKNAAIRAYGATLIEHGGDYQEAREFALRLEVERGLHMVRSFTPELLRGVATYPLELFKALPELDAVYVPVGMGAGISATLLVRDLLKLKTKIIGVVTDGAPTYALSFEKGSPVPTETAETFVDGLACRTPDPGVVELIHRRAERIVRVTDTEVLDAMAFYLIDTHHLAEGSGAAALAGLMKERQKMKGKRVAVILTGSNLDTSLLPMLSDHVKGLES